MNVSLDSFGKINDESNLVIYNPANPFLVSPYEPVQSTQDTNTLRIVYTDVITSFTPNTEIQIGAPVTIENVTVNGSSVGSAGQISNGATSVRADLAAIRYAIAGDEQVVFTPGNAQFASALSGYNVTIGGKWNIYNTVATIQKGLAGYVPLAVNGTQYSMPIFSDASFSIVPTPTSETVSGTTALNPNTDITYLAGSTNSLPIGTVAGQKKLLINLNADSQVFLPLGPAPGTLTATDVNAIAITSPTTVYIGGDTLNFGTGSNAIVRLNPQTQPQTYSSAGTGLPSAICYSITSVSPTNIFAGLSVTSGSNGGIYKSDGSSWSLLGNGVSSAGTSRVYATYYDSVSKNLYIGGDFEKVNGGTIILKSLAIYDTSNNSWSTALGSVAGVAEIVRAILKVGDNVFVGGNFTHVGSTITPFSPGTPANSIAKWDTSNNTWSALGGGLGTGTCLSLGSDGTYLYVGGSFADASGVANTANFARYDISGNAWTSVGQLNNECKTIAVTPTGVYIGGKFTSVNGVTGINRIARYDLALATWFPLLGGIGDNDCNTIAIDAVSNLYAGGNFTIVNGSSIRYITYYSSTNQTVVSAGALLRNGATYTTMTFKRQYSTILLCYNGTEWVIVQTNPFVLFT